MRIDNADVLARAHQDPCQQIFNPRDPVVENANTNRKNPGSSLASPHTLWSVQRNQLWLADVITSSQLHRDTLNGVGFVTCVLGHKLAVLHARRDHVRCWSR